MEEFTIGQHRFGCDVSHTIAMEGECRDLTHEVAIAFESVQQSGIPIEALEQRPTLIREMVETIKHDRTCGRCRNYGHYDCNDCGGAAILAALEVKE